MQTSASRPFATLAAPVAGAAPALQYALGIDRLMARRDVPGTP